MLPYQIIQQELRSSGRRFVEKRKDFATTCINPGCPSLDGSLKLKLEISKDGTKVHCWVCDWSGSWDKFAKATGLQTLKSTTPGCYSSQAINTNFSEQLYKDLVQEIETPKGMEKAGYLPNNIKPWAQYTDQSYRGLSVDFLTSLHAYYWLHQTEHKNANKVYNFTTHRLLLPFYQNKRLVGYTGRRLDDLTVTKYYNAPWAEAKKILYPYDYVVNQKPEVVVLVEGQIDALALINAGIPALCILGTNNWSSTKISYLLNSTIQKVFVCMDGDKAGRLAAPDIVKSLETAVPSVESILLPEGDDPGSLKPDQLTWLKSYIGIQ
jgi:hypothetical protein